MQAAAVVMVAQWSGLVERRTVALVVGLAIAFTLVAGTTAQASTLARVTIGPFTFWTFTADSGKANDITISKGTGARFVLSDPSDTITVTSTPTCPTECVICDGAGSTEVDCAMNQGLTVNAGNLGDTIAVAPDLIYTMSLNGQDGADDLTGGPAAETLDGGASGDSIDGGPGNDTVRGGAGADTGMVGGAGTDTLSYDDGRASGVAASLTSGANGDGDTFSGMEILHGSDLADTLTGTAGANELNGLDGDDLLVGGGGADTLRGGVGTDTAGYEDGRTANVNAVLGGANTDGDIYDSIANLTGGPGDDVLTGNDLANTLTGGGGDDLVIGGLGADHLIGGAGRNTASYQERATAVSAGVSIGGPKPDGDSYTQIQSLRGGGGDDRLSGDAGENTLDGGPGDDVLIGAGDDDDLIGGGGRNTASYEERATPVSASLAPAGPKPDSDVYLQIQNLRGGSGGDTLTGDGGANTFEAGPGADTINARDGAADTVNCGSETDTANVDLADAVSACELVRRPDGDGDGFDVAADCDDGNPAINPGAQEVLDNPADENCDRIVGFTTIPDGDGDGFNARLDCDDGNAAVRPGALEIPGNNVDENCDGSRPDFPVIGASIVIFVKATSRLTRVTELTVRGIPAGGRVVILCRRPKGKRRACPFTRVTRKFPAARRKVNLVKSFKRRRMPLGTEFEVRVIAPNAIGKVRIERVRRSKTTRRLLCLRPGASRPSKCPNT